MIFQESEFLKGEYISRKEGIFHAILISFKKVAILLLGGEGTSDSLLENMTGEKTFEEFLEGIENCDSLIVDLENLSFIGSKLYGFSLIFQK